MARPLHRAHSRAGPAALARNLAWLRLCAIGGQSAAVLVCALWLHLSIPLLPLMAGVGVLAVFSVYAAWRVNHASAISEWETVAHVGVDTLVLGYLLYLTGGATNPFITLLLVPIALSAAALSVTAVLAVAALAGLAYLLLLIAHVPLPVASALYSADEFSLHVAGMGANFLIMAALLGFFIHRLARAVRLQQQEIQRVRERALRDEGILAIATQAAGAAHELNTPLSTMRTLLPEVRRDHAGDAALAEDLQLLQDQVDRCRLILREMVAFGKAQLSQQVQSITVRDLIHGCIERFVLLRPEAELTLELDEATAAIELHKPPGLRHALLNLLNNAVDASAMAQSTAVSLRAVRDGGWLELQVTDRGPGFDFTDGFAELGESGKPAGLGLGLALAEATAERLNGELTARNTDVGAQVTLRLPLPR